MTCTSTPAFVSGTTGLRCVVALLCHLIENVILNSQVDSVADKGCRYLGNFFFFFFSFLVLQQVGELLNYLRSASCLLFIFLRDWDIVEICSVNT